MIPWILDTSIGSLSKMVILVYKESAYTMAVTFSRSDKSWHKTIVEFNSIQFNFS